MTVTKNGLIKLTRSQMDTLRDLGRTGMELVPGVGRWIWFRGGRRDTQTAGPQDRTVRLLEGMGYVERVEVHRSICNGYSKEVVRITEAGRERLSRSKNT